MNIPTDTLHAVIIDLIGRAKERGCALVEALLPEDLDRLGSADLRKAAHRGLLNMAADLMHRERHFAAGSVANKSSPSSFTADGRNPSARHDALRIVWTSAGGGLKELADFNSEDCKALVSESASKESGWRKKKEWAQAAMKALDGKAETTPLTRLPKKTLNELRELAAEAWG